MQTVGERPLELTQAKLVTPKSEANPHENNATQARFTPITIAGPANGSRFIQRDFCSIIPLMLQSALVKPVAHGKKLEAQ